ncbi:Uncharacterised protein [Chlamydia trachomatis]|nr:Uncharacterised protein [Chlamydia trachomatis]
MLPNTLPALRLEGIYHLIAYKLALDLYSINGSVLYKREYDRAPLHWLGHR